MFLLSPSPLVIGGGGGTQGLHNWTTPPGLLLAVCTLILSQAFPDCLPAGGSKPNREGNLAKEQSFPTETFRSLEKAGTVSSPLRTLLLLQQIISLFVKKMR